MKRLCLLGMAVAGLLTAGITTAATAKQPTGTKPATKAHSGGGSKTKAKKPVAKPKPLKLSDCKLALVTVPPANQPAVTPPLTSGAQFGSFSCAAPIGQGAVSDRFTTDDQGDITANVALWTDQGKLTGKLTLTVSGASEPTTGFGNQTYDASLAITGGSLLKALAVKAPTKPITLKTATTTDSVHYSLAQ